MSRQFEHVLFVRQCAGGAVSMKGVTPSSNALYNGVPLEPAPSVRQACASTQTVVSIECSLSSSDGKTLFDIGLSTG